MILTAIFTSLCLQAADEGQNIQRLRDASPQVRAAAATILGEEGSKRAIPQLIQLLRDEDTGVKTAAHNALRKITGENLELNPQAWTQWWEENGRERFALPQVDLRDEVERIRLDLAATQDEHRRGLEEHRRGLEETTRLVWAGVFISLGLWAVFIVAILYFTGHLSSKLKEWKELMKQADHYLRESERVTERTDRVLDELEAKKTEILEFFAKLKDENEGEIERFTDLLEQNTEHHLRLEVMTLRQKAEKELQQTLAELKADLDHGMHRLAAQHRDQVERDLARRWQEFHARTESQMLFLEANFLLANGRPEEALRLFRKIVAAHTGHAIAWTRIANILRDLGRFDEALEAYRAALAAAPEDPQIHYHLAAAYARMKKKEPMLKALAHAFSHNGEFKDEALNDPAFKPYWEDAEFKNLAEA